MSQTRHTLQLLRDYESRNVLFTEPDGSWPIVWERARGVRVWDAEGKQYLDLTARLASPPPVMPTRASSRPASAR